MRLWALAAALVATSTLWAAERGAAAKAEFRKTHPCPVTGKTTGACPGWQVDHAIPLCMGGADAPANMQWLQVETHQRKTVGDVRECRVRKLGREP